MSQASLGKLLLEWTGVCVFVCVCVGGGGVVEVTLASFVVVAESTCIYFTDRSPHTNERQTVEI